MSNTHPLLAIAFVKDGETLAQRYYLEGELVASVSISNDNCMITADTMFNGMAKALSKSIMWVEEVYTDDWESYQFPVWLTVKLEQAAVQPKTEAKTGKVLVPPSPDEDWPECEPKAPVKGLYLP